MPTRRDNPTFLVTDLQARSDVEGWLSSHFVRD
jgi:hypothetical protein